MGGFLGGSAPIRFDFDGALRAARRLHELAVEVDGVRSRRAVAGDDASTGWQGMLLDEFHGRRTDDDMTLSGLSTQLRAGAAHWAQQWQHVMSENNERARARRVQQISDERSGLGKVWDLGPGSDDSNDKVGPAVCPRLPVPPGFWPTSGPQRF